MRLKSVLVKYEKYGLMSIYLNIVIINNIYSTYSINHIITYLISEKFAKQMLKIKTSLYQGQTTKTGRPIK